MLNAIEIGPAKKVTITDDIVEKLIAHIADNKIKPGEMLPSEKQLGTALGVSRLPLREALSRLKALGIVNSRQGKGVFVCNVDASNLLRQISPVMRSQGNLGLMHMMDIRQALEPAVAKLAAQRRNIESLAVMKKCIEGMEKNLNSPFDFTVYDIEFHRALVEATGNPALVTLVDILHGLISKTQHEVRKNRTITRTLFAYHVDIYEAVLDGNPTAAFSAMQEHLRDATSSIESMEDK